MAAMHPVPSSSFSTWSPLAVTATACLGAAILRITHKINTLATSIIAVGAISQYLFHRSNAKSTLDSYAQDSFDTYKYQADDLVVKNRSLETAYDNEKQRSSHYETLSQSMLASNRDHQKEIDALRQLIDEFEEQTVEQTLTESMTGDKGISDSWAFVQSQNNEELEDLKAKVKKLETSAQSKEKQAKEKLREMRQLEDALKQKLKLLQIQEILESLKNMDQLLHSFYPKVRESMSRAELHICLCRKIKVDLEPLLVNPKAKIELIKLKLEEIFKLSKKSYEVNVSNPPVEMALFQIQLDKILNHIKEIATHKARIHP